MSHSFVYVSVTLNLMRLSMQQNPCQPAIMNCPVLWDMTPCRLVCIYACMRDVDNVCMHICMYVCTYACMYVCMYVRMYVCMYVRMYVCMCVRMYVCTYVRMYCTYVCTYVCMYVYTYVCVYVNLPTLQRILLPPSSSENTQE
jgi:hypothetical protein